MKQQKEEENRRHEAAMQRRYEQLPELAPDLLADWLTGRVPDSAFVDGQTHQSSTWTCERISSLVADLDGLAITTVPLGTYWRLDNGYVEQKTGDMYDGREAIWTARLGPKEAFVSQPTPLVDFRALKNGYGAARGRATSQRAAGAAPAPSSGGCSGCLIAIFVAILLLALAAGLVTYVGTMGS